MTDDSPDRYLRMGKMLAHTNKKACAFDGSGYLSEVQQPMVQVRDRAVKVLTRWLTNQQAMTERHPSDSCRPSAVEFPVPPRGPAFDENLCPCGLFA